MVDRIGTEGLNQLARDFRRAGDALPKGLAAINKRLVNTVFVPAARSKAAGRTNPRAGHAVTDSIRGLGSQTRAQIAGGSNRVPWFAGHNYGSQQLRRTARGGHTTQFPRRAPKRGRGNVGYILEQAVEEQLPEGLTAYARMLDDLLGGHG